MLLFSFLMACSGDADVRLGDALPDAGADAGPFEGDDVGECSDGGDNDRDGLFDCDDPECAGASDCVPVDTGDTDTGPADTGDSSDTAAEDTADSSSNGDTAETGMEEPTCETTATRFVGVIATCADDIWTVTAQTDGPPVRLFVGFQLAPDGTPSTAWDSRDGSLALSGSCCNVVHETRWTCADDLSIPLSLLDADGGAALEITRVGPASAGDAEWLGPAPTCP